jgi:hypothetical protein
MVHVGGINSDFDYSSARPASPAPVFVGGMVKTGCLYFLNALQRSEPGAWMGTATQSAAALTRHVWIFFE